MQLLTLVKVQFAGYTAFVTTVTVGTRAIAQIPGQDQIVPTLNMVEPTI